MKTVCFFAFLFLSALVTAQSNPQAGPPAPRTFQPLAQPGQQRPLVPPPARWLNAKRIYYLILVAVLLIIFGGATLAFLKTPSTLVRLLIVAGALGSGAVVTFALLFSIGITGTPDNSPAGLARRALLEMGKALGLSIETSAVAIADEDYRLGLLLGDQALVVADYGENRGLLVPYRSLDTVISHTGTALTLPPLPTPAADRWIMATRTAQQASDTTSLYQLEWHFRGLNPSIVAIRYAQPDYFFPEVSSIANLCRLRAQEAQ